MDAIMAVKRGDEGAALPALRERRVKAVIRPDEPTEVDTVRSDVAVDVDIPKVPFFGSRIVKGIPLADYVGMLDERALFMGQWGLKGARGEYEAMAETEGRPRLRALLNEVQSKELAGSSCRLWIFPMRLRRK